MNANNNKEMTSDQKKFEILNCIFKTKDGASWNEVSEMLNEYREIVINEQNDSEKQEIINRSRKAYP